MITLNIDEMRARYILEAIRVCDAEWQRLAQENVDNDESDYENDRMRLHLAEEAFEEAAVEAFGSKVKEFSTAALPARKY
jgi:hypothetical protein